MNKKLILAVTLVIGVAINSASAQIIRSKVPSDRNRIHNGVRTGQLTRPEAYRLHREKRDIRRDIHRSRKDGHIDRAERTHIRHEKRKHSRHIYRAKHNGRKRS
jgi:hypothetical protein